MFSYQMTSSFVCDENLENHTQKNTRTQRTFARILMPHYDHVYAVESRFKSGIKKESCDFHNSVVIFFFCGVE